MVSTKLKLHMIYSNGAELENWKFKKTIVWKIQNSS